MGHIVQSATLARLIDELAAGSTDAVDRFWSRIEATGTPIFEPVEDQPDLRLVTFVWRASGPVENVLLMEWFTDRDFPAKGMEQIPDTDIWFASFVMRSDVRSTYQFAENDSLTPRTDEKDWEARFAKMRHDPFNPLTFKLEASGRRGAKAVDPVESILELPDAAPQPWFGRRPGVASGTVRKHRSASGHLGNERDLWLYEPAKADAEGLVIAFDAERWNDNCDLPSTLDNLIATGEIPPVAAVMLGNVDRNLELPCYPPFAAYIADELVPWIRSETGLALPAERVIACGHSYGGLASMFVALERPEVVGNVLSQSGSYWWKPDVKRDEEPVIGEAPDYAVLPTRVAREGMPPVRIYMDAGRMENRAFLAGAPSLLGANRHMRDVLTALGADLEYREFAGGHDSVWWRSTVADGLTWITRDWD